jgi:ankyrin repeat protein
MQNKEGNTVLHECAINNKITLANKIRNSGLVDEYIENH